MYLAGASQLTQTQWGAPFGWGNFWDGGQDVAAVEDRFVLAGPRSNPRL
jgi:hypothetical protein